MESWVEATAVLIKDKEVKRKSDGRSFTIYTIETDHGELTTSKRELAEHAFQYLHTPARYLINVKQNGNFTNNYLEDIAPIPPNQASSAPQAQEAPAVPTAPAVPATAPSLPAPTPEPPPDIVRGQAVPDWTDKDLAIYRQTAAKVAALTSRTPDEFWDNIDHLFKFFCTGNKPTGSESE